MNEEQRLRNKTLVLAGCLLVVMVVVVLAIANASKAEGGSTTLIDPSGKPVDGLQVSSQKGMLPSTINTFTGVSSSFCDGYEVLCSSSTTEKPAETLVQLAAALSTGDAKRYRVKVSVIPLDEE